ncbi:MAG TPA: sugar phosphate isomerase/epimerase family protein [Spirillospora sp.]|nr:sugar phosphate isomerase/epimerase family protein [Spirillospora sp.]
MRLGGVDEWFGGWNKITDEVARKIVALGFTGMGLHYHGDPLEQSLDDALRTKAILDAHGIEIVQFWGSYPCIICPDEDDRREGVRIGRNIVRRAAELGSLVASIRPTSLHPTSQWGPHPLNYAPETEDRLVRSLSEIAEACETYQMPIALEVHVTTTLRDAETIRRLIERTGSSWIRVNADLVNFIPDFKTAYDTTTMINHVFDVLGPYIITAHLKDVVVDEPLVVHISEARPGTGLLDWDTLFRRFEALLPDGYALIEHLTDYQDVMLARDFVVGKLNALNIPIRQ